MKILKLVRTNYATFGIGPSHQSNQKYAFSKRVHIWLLLLGCTIVSQCVYVCHVESDFMEYIEWFSSISGTIIMLICFEAMAVKRGLLFESIESIEKLIETRCKYPKSEAFFLKTNGQVEELSDIVFTMLVKIAVPCFILPKFIVGFGDYFTTDSGRDSFQLPYPLWFPFDWHSPVGYLMAVIIEYLILAFEYVMHSCTLGLGIGAFWFAISATKEIQRILHSISVKAKAKKLKKNRSNELKVLFVEFIDIHAAMNRLVRNFSEILQPIFMSLFTWSLLAISGAMLIFQVEILHDENVVPVLLNATLNGIVGLIAVFIACELSQRMSDAFATIDFTVDQFDWYLFSIEIQRMLPMIIANTQEAVTLECFGSIACTREVFRNFLHCAYSYFTVLSQVGN